MSQLRFVIQNWTGDAAADASLERATLAELRIEADSESGPVVLTEVHDQVAQTVRTHVVVPLYPLAEWLLVNWWRLRWEPRRSSPEWRMVHSLAAISGGDAWPPLDISSLGSFIQLDLLAERCSPASVRYLYDTTVQVPAADFEAQVDRLVRQVQDRLSSLGRPTDDLEALRRELEAERRDPTLARQCRIQAEAGIDPGDATEEWLEEVDELEREAGEDSTPEVLAILPSLHGSLPAARKALEELRQSSQTIDLSWVPAGQSSINGEVPWKVGARLAREFRQQHGLSENSPIPTSFFEERLGTKLPLSKSSELSLGAFRQEADEKETSLLVTNHREESQRFWIARLIACSLVTAESNRLLPVTQAATALQKLERSFGQELLCPWPALDELTDHVGTDDEGIAQAADHFNVSERVVLSTLVNKKKIERHRLEQA